MVAADSESLAPADAFSRAPVEEHLSGGVEAPSSETAQREQGPTSRAQRVSPASSAVSNAGCDPPSAQTSTNGVSDPVLARRDLAVIRASEMVNLAWDKSLEHMTTIPQHDAQELSLDTWYTIRGKFFDSILIYAQKELNAKW